jgi:aconitate decarboxylase
VNHLADNAGDAGSGAPAVTTPLATWVATSSPDDIPEAVQESARRLVLDGLGCALFGSSLPWARIVAEHVVETGGPGVAAVWGTPHRVPVTAAPLANGTATHAFEYDDLHPRAVLHAGAQIVPAAVAIAELRESDHGNGRPPWLPGKEVSGTELLHAMVLGFEAAARIGLATGTGQLARGFHPSPNTATFAAAATAARLLHLDAEHTAHALGIAGSFGGYLMAAQYGAMVKRVHPGHSSQTGVTAALLAARGLTGTPGVLEAPYGGFAAAYADAGAEQLQAIVDELGSRWEIPSFSIKYYPCCGSNHTSLEALWSLRAEHPGLGGEDIDRITVHCSTLTADHVGWPYVPSSVTTAQMNLAYCLAVAIIDKQVGADQFRTDRLAAPEVLDLIARTDVVVDPQIDALGRSRRHAVRVVVATRDGRRIEASAEHPKGSAHNPMTPQEVVGKFRDLSSRALDTTAVAEVEDRVLTLGQQGAADVMGLTRAMATGQTDRHHPSKTTQEEGAVR